MKNVLPDLSAVADDPLNQTSAGPSKRQVEVYDGGKETAISNSNPYAEGKLQVRLCLISLFCGPSLAGMMSFQC